MGSCFVIMGFGEKTDFQSNPQRVLDLNYTYETIIKPAVTDAGLDCFRADEVIHSGVIDKPMYDNLLSADLVVADLSTSNANAIYELGVRHALRPRRTIVMADEKFNFPFDLNHLSILKYKHGGADIGYREVLRVKDLLKQKVIALMDKADIDSPVFLFIPTLTRASLPGASVEAVQAAAPAPSSEPTDAKSFAELLENFRRAKAATGKAADWAAPLALLKRLQTMQPDDPYILQQLALATYKHKQPDPKTSLVEAKNILQKLAPQTSSDAESVGLWGAIHKRLWEETANRDDLNEAIQAYARGYYIKNDYYNGINYAFMLDVRASASVGDEALTDRVLARRVRKEVLDICDRLLQVAVGPAAHQHPLSDDVAFWIGATRVEALFGLGRKDEGNRLRQEVFVSERGRLNKLGAAQSDSDWKVQSLNEQLVKLDKLLASPAGP